jgi:shikimate kinase
MIDKLPLIDRPIVLVGLMGAGKSTIGKRLARRLGLGFVDSDSEIETAAAHSIAEIFARFGEESFRDGERRVIERLIEGPPKVIATGGGAFMNERTRKLILERCIALWLDADIETLAKRVSRRNTRPLLKDKDPLLLLRELAATRNRIYAEAHIHIHSHPTPHEETVDQMIEALKKWNLRP